MYELGKVIQITDFDDRQETEITLSRLKHDLDMLHQHAVHENLYIFPKVQPNEPKMIDTLTQQHEEIERKIAAMLKTTDDLNRIESRDQRMEKGDTLYQEANDLFAFYLTHNNNEEATILPATQKYYTDEALRAVRATIMNNMSPEQSADWLRWIFSSINNNEATSLLAEVKKAAPPPIFERMSRIAEEAIGEDRWKTIQSELGP
jgi:RNA polymerase-binding transcription factor DksA